LALAAAFTSRAAEIVPSDEISGCGRLCTLFDHVLNEKGPIEPCKSDVVPAGVVAAADVQALGAASREVVSLLLSGHAVSLAVPNDALEAAKEMVAGFPPQLLQAVALGPMATLPQTVRTFRAIGVDSSELWAERVPPADFGGFVSSDAGWMSHGMSAGPSAMSLVRAPHSPHGGSLSRLKQHSNVLEALIAMLTKGQKDYPLDDACSLVELLWLFRKPAAVHGAKTRHVSLEAASKHIIITSTTSVAVDVVKAAIVNALSPFEEKVKVHAIGLGNFGLKRDPLQSFCRLVQSGKHGLEWRIEEHKDWSSFLEWLHVHAVEEPEPLQLFSTQRQLEIEIRRRCAEVGGVAWSRLFTPEPFEQLRRWTTVRESAELDGN